MAHNEHTRLQHPIIWLTGQTGAGKTTHARLLARELGAVVLDGDEMRESISRGASFTKEDRNAHNMRVARLALVLSRQMPVVVAVIAPFEETRRKIHDIIAPVWVYVKRNVPTTADTPYEEPHSADVVVEVTADTKPEENVEKIVGFLRSHNRA